MLDARRADARARTRLAEARLTGADLGERHDLDRAWDGLARVLHRIDPHANVLEGGTSLGEDPVVRLLRASEVARAVDLLDRKAHQRESAIEIVVREQATPICASERVSADEVRVWLGSALETLAEILRRAERRGLGLLVAIG